MTAQKKLALYNSVLDELSQIKVLFINIGYVPVSIMNQFEILEALTLKQIKDLEIE